MYYKKISLVLLATLMASCTSVPDHTVATSEFNKSRGPAVGGVKLQDSKDFTYEVLFTNPVCGPYTYTKDVLSFNKKRLTQKPLNVFCKNLYDLKNSGNQTSSPQYRLIEWINDSETKEIFMTYLSYRNKAVTKALCEAIKTRGLKFTLVMSRSEDDTIAQTLKDCDSSQDKNLVRIEKRGQEGGIGYAHNKITIINPQLITDSSREEKVKIVFSSGNMTSGPVIHHENWHFITTSAHTHFAQMHKCVMNAELDAEAGHDALKYAAYIQNCRQFLASKGLPEEDDIKVFFVPGEGETAMFDGKKRAFDFMNNGDGVNPGIRNAKEIRIGAHRFFYNKMINALRTRMNGPNRPILKIIADDDTFYKGYLGEEAFSLGDTDPMEWTNMQQLQSLGAELKFMETNHEEHQLHHSKFLIFDDKAVLAGSANLTGAGFRTNWENIYYISIPTVVQAFRTQYDETLWGKLATSPMDLPMEPILADAVQNPVQNTASILAKDNERQPASIPVDSSLSAVCGDLYARGDTNQFVQDVQDKPTEKISYYMRLDCNQNGRIDPLDKRYAFLQVKSSQQKGSLTKMLKGDRLARGSRSAHPYICAYNIKNGTPCESGNSVISDAKYTKTEISGVYKKVFNKDIEVDHE